MEVSMITPSISRDEHFYHNSTFQKLFSIQTADYSSVKLLLDTYIRVPKISQPVVGLKNSVI